MASSTNAPTTTKNVSGNTAKPKIPLYEAATQFRNWRFSVDGLAKLRASMNQVAVDAIRKKIEADQPGSSETVSFLTPNEEVLLVKLYLTKITQLCTMFRFPEEIEATATSYLKRFYLRNTVMDWHPKNVMLTALFLATKTCNFPISLETYTKHIPRTQPSDVLDLEFLVAQSLSFEFTVWHAHRALWGIWLDVQSLPDAPVQLQPDLYNAALGHVRASRLTDAEFIYTPSQIALAAFSMEVPEIATRWAESKNSEEHKINLTLSEEIKSLILADGKPPNVDAVREADRRLKLCKNPEKVPGSKAFLAKKAEEEREAAEKRNKKAAQVQQALNDGDPFGNDVDKPRNGLVDYDDDDDD
ncbi:cyclin-like protein [Coprinopsis marcescibilis]|uniref:Cyclin-like protein n=1 Tax=Coprinopsis marcescibilis TaxID=230819 RepID=A0A5C3LPE1_COPMA|nr:cyclin-like protein [Coprinopsis marcescibilis]